MKTYSVWQFVDGRTGHERQSSGLLSALARSVPLDVHVLPAIGNMPAAWWWLLGRFPPGTALPDPQLIVGAGHATHLSVLAARRARGGRAVILMPPSLPTAFFDLCIIPEHDGVPPGSNVLVTRGALNVVEPGGSKTVGHGLFLIGGPSRHHLWDDDGIAEQVVSICRREPQRRWQLTTSRRTPDTFVAAMQARQPENLVLVRYQDTDPDWLPAVLAQSERVWVSEDSVSMVYEALTAGAATGVLAVRRRRESKVSRGLDRQAHAGTVTLFADWAAGRELTPPREPFDEARRCADWLIEHWMGGADSALGNTAAR